jgi:hypothetical protein
MDGGRAKFTVSRRAALRGAAVAGAALVAGSDALRHPQVTHAHNLPLGAFQDRYEAAVSRPALHYQLYQFPNIQNPTLWSNIRNGLNGAQFSYGEPPGSLQVVVQCYVTGNSATYNDAMWAKYRFGEKYEIRDRTTGQPATRNIFYPRTTTGGADLPLENAQSLYNDTGIAGLMERGVVFLT